MMVVLAVGLDSTLLRTQASIWKAAGCIVRAAGSIREALQHLRDGDFDLVLLGPFLPPEKRRKLTGLIRALGSRVPVASIAKSSGDRDPFADATLNLEPREMLAAMNDLVAKRREGWR
jgi:DNA-binding NtrC family response regulator